MKFWLIRILLAGTLGGGALQAANLLTVTPATISLTCNTITGPGPAVSVAIKPAATLGARDTIAVTLGALTGGLVVTPPPAAVLNAANQAPGITYAVSLGPGCAGAASGSTAIRFYAGGIADVSVAVTSDVTATASPLVGSPVAITCTRTPGAPLLYQLGPAQTVSVASAAPGGTPFTVNSTASPAWVSVTPAGGGLANAVGVTLSVAPAFPCGNFPAGSKNAGSIHLKNAPAPDALIPVTLQILSQSPLTATPAAPAFTYTKGSGNPASVDVGLSAAAATAFTVDTTSLPAWLTVDATTGTTPQSLHFTTTSVSDTMVVGSYNVTVRIQASGFGDLLLPVRLSVANPAPKLTVAEGTERELTWAMGQPLPIPYITLASSGAAIPYSIATGGALAPLISAGFLQGFAYSGGTPIPVTFSPTAFAPAQPGAVLTGTVTVTWGSPSVATVITIRITVQAAPATLLSISPATLPTAPPGQSFMVALLGNGFVAGSDATPGTMVGVVSGGILAADANLAATVVNASNIMLTITVPATADPYLPFSPSGIGGAVVLGVCNPQGSPCTVPTGTVQLSLGPAPVIQAVTSASAYVQAALPALPTIAPYDMIAIFGTSFCTSGGTGCTGGQVLYGMADAATLRYPVSLSPDAAGSGQRLLTVTFQTHAKPPVLIANAPLLFATNGQINLIVPAAVASYVGRSIDLVVNFGVPGASLLSSIPYPVSVAAADPGVFTVETDGQGEGAILSTDWSRVTVGNEAGMRSKPADSDVVQIYMTGLGAPDSSADNGTPGAGQWPADCVSTASYLAAFNRQMSTLVPSLDGILIASGLLGGNRLVPCLRTTPTIPTVTIGGQPATVTYAGWVGDALAGEYQVNVRLPGSASGSFTAADGSVLAPPLTGPVKLPVVVTARGRSSQPGVTIWVAPRLKVTAPAAAALHGAAGAAWAATGNLVAATEGTPPYQYAVTSGALPAGVTLDPSTGAISGTPGAAAAGTYNLVITATDSAARPLQGAVAFTLVVDSVQ